MRALQTDQAIDIANLRFANTTPTKPYNPNQK